MPRPAPQILLSDDQRRTLDAWRDTSRTPRQVGLRTRIVLLAAAGASNRAIARALKTTLVTVLLWRKRFAEGGTEALLELAPGRGPRRRISPRKVQQIVEATRQTPPAGEKRWSVRSMARAQGVSQTTVQRIWDEYDLKPHLTRLVRPVRDVPVIVGLYLNPPDKVLALVLDRLPSRKRLASRNRPPGAASFAGTLRELESRIVGESRWRPRQQGFFVFLRRLERWVRTGSIHLVVDGEGTHLQDYARAWFKPRRFRLHLTPAGEKWSDWVERWLGAVRWKRAPRESSLGDVEQDIRGYLAAKLTQPVPYAWPRRTE